MDFKAFGIYLAALGIIIIANTVFRIAETIHSQSFDKEALWSGLKKNILVFIGMSLIFCAGYLLPEVSITFSGEEVTLVEGVRLVILASIAYYGVKCLSALKDLLLPSADASNKKESDSEEGEASK